MCAKLHMVPTASLCRAALQRPKWKTSLTLDINWREIPSIEIPGQDFNAI